MELFNRDRNGREEIVDAIGLISSDITFDKWACILPMGMRDLAAIIGRDTLDAISVAYNDKFSSVDNHRIVSLAQKAVAFFTWLKIIPTLDAQHDDTGRSRRLGENEKGLTALQEFKDEENILRLAYEATDALIEEMELSMFTPWLESRKYQQREGLLIAGKEEFDDYYYIGSHRLFVTLLPIIREVQGASIAPVLGRARLKEILDEPDGEVALALREPASRALALLTMKKAVERLPVEVIPDGVVQVQQSQPIKQRLRAEQSARQAVALSLGEDAGRYLETLQALVAEIDAAGSENDDTIPGVIVHSKGMSF